MTERVAKVEDLDAIKAFKRAIWKFAEAANVALGDAEGEMNRALMWLEGEQRAYWEGQVRKRADLVERAKEAVRMKKIFKDSTGRQQSAVDEEKKLKVAIKRFEEAEEKVAAVKKHTAKLRKEILMYKGHVQRFATAVQNDLPMASAQLDGLLDRLRQYVALDVPEAVRSTAPSDAGPDASVTQVTGSMSRGEAPEKPAPAPPPAPPPQETPQVREEDEPQPDPPANPA
jgi:hypothetical protein